MRIYIGIILCFIGLAILIFQPISCDRVSYPCPINKPLIIREIDNRKSYAKIILPDIITLEGSIEKTLDTLFFLPLSQDYLEKTLICYDAICNQFKKRGINDQEHDSYLDDYKSCLLQYGKFAGDETPPDKDIDIDDKPDSLQIMKMILLRSKKMWRAM